MADPKNWRERLQGWAERADEEARAWGAKAEATLRELGDNPYVQQAASMGQRATEEIGAFADRLAENEVVQATRERLNTSPLWAETARRAAQVRESEAWQQLEATAERASEGAKGFAQSAGETIARVQADAEVVVGALDAASSTPEDRAVVVESALRAFEKVGPQLDLLADAVAVGTIQEAGAGVASIQGTELVFVPADGPVRAQLRVNRIVGQSARLAIGGQVGAYAAAFYGPRSLLVRSLHRRGADLGLIALSLGFFRTSHPSAPEFGAGWLIELAAGLNFGIPILSDLSAFELEEVTLAQYSLEAEETEALDAALASAPDRAGRRKVARLLARDPEGKPS